MARNCIPRLPMSPPTTLAMHMQPIPKFSNSANSDSDKHPKIHCRKKNSTKSDETLASSGNFFL
jgi:hypothetical protein